MYITDGLVSLFAYNYYCHLHFANSVIYIVAATCTLAHGKPV